MGKMSREKGRRGELEAARIFSSWWCGDTSLLKAKAEALPIRRTPMSGGWARAKGIGGDLVPVHDSCRDFNILSVEVKNNEGWDFDGILKNKKWPVCAWWKQCVEAADASKSVPLLVMTKNHHPFYFCFDRRNWKRLIQGTCKRCSCIYWKKYVFGLLSSFTDTFTRSDIRKVFGRRNEEQE